MMQCFVSWRHLTSYGVIRSAIMGITVFLESEKIYNGKFINIKLKCKGNVKRCKFVIVLKITLKKRLQNYIIGQTCISKIPRVMNKQLQKVTASQKKSPFLKFLSSVGGGGGGGGEEFTFFLISEYWEGKHPLPPSPTKKDHFRSIVCQMLTYNIPRNYVAVLFVVLVVLLVHVYWPRLLVDTHITWYLSCPVCRL